MGIRFLNKVIQAECDDSVICNTSLFALSGRRIAVDISIYMHYFEGDELLIEQLFRLTHAFYMCQIQGIFVFDGKTPYAKRNVVAERRKKKQAAQENCNQLVKDGADPYSDEVKNLKKNSAHLTPAKVEQVKEFLRNYGMQVCQAAGEADEVCASLAAQGLVWAVMSDDTDMFLYNGCRRVLRNLVLNPDILPLSTLQLYDTNEIHSGLNMSRHEFVVICALTELSSTLCVEREEDAWLISNTYDEEEYEQNEPDEYKDLTVYETLRYIRAYQSRQTDTPKWTRGIKITAPTDGTWIRQPSPLTRNTSTSTTEEEQSPELEEKPELKRKEVETPKKNAFDFIRWLVSTQRLKKEHIPALRRIINRYNVIDAPDKAYMRKWLRETYANNCNMTLLSPQTLNDMLQMFGFIIPDNISFERDEFTTCRAMALSEAVDIDCYKSGEAAFPGWL